ncbi:catenin delta-2-like isoform X3 [Tachypleus tridentatus]|uniref:catenin delta-2-like isoform X3 n=2 Tax=Tachypleus tridentatus TaxID=6853 RepID=UPI003FD43845
MPVEDLAIHNRPVTYSPTSLPGQSAATILQSVKEQEAQFKELTRELEAERQSVATQLETYKRREREQYETGNLLNYGSTEDRENSYDWRSPSSHSLVFRENSEQGRRMADSHLQEGAPQGIPYYQAPPANGHHGEESTLTPSQVKTISGNKVIGNHPVRHLAAESQSIGYSPYNSGHEPHPHSEYITYAYNTPGDGPQRYQPYDARQLTSPSGQIPTGGYHHGFGSYDRAPSPGPPRNQEAYLLPGGQGYPEYGYQDLPVQPPSPPSGASESPPPPRRVMPQNLHPAQLEYSHRPSGYNDLTSTTLALPGGRGYQDRYGRTPSPAPPPGERFGPYGYSGAHLPPTSPGYSSYETAPPPQGYLDRRPSYDDRPPSQGTPTHLPRLYSPASRTVFQEEDDKGLPPEAQNPPPPPRQSPLEYETEDVRWRDPDLHEVIDFLSHPNNVIRANAAGYLQHLCYNDDHMKQKTRALGGMPPLIELLNQDIPEIQRNASGALRNLSYGRQNDENKRAIKNAGGIPALVRLLRKTPDNEIKELVTGILWNLSSSEDIKRSIIDDGLTVIVNHVIIPHSGWDCHRDPVDQPRVQEICWSTVFRNASGILRNISSAGEYSRRKMRECEGLVEALLYLVKAAIGKNDMDNKSVENCVCVLRNLSFRCQEVEDPEYDKRILQPSHSRSGPMKMGDSLGCFGTTKKKKDGESTEKQKKEVPLSSSQIQRSGPVQGMELLWQPEVVQPYLALLSECSNPETLEAAAGAIQNLAACYWQPSLDIRAAVRKEKGLPVLVELLRMDVDRVVCAVATALRNLSMDQRNKELIGKYAMRDLVQKLPSSDPQQEGGGSSDETIAAVLATLNEVIIKNSDFARSLLEAGGVDRLTYIAKQKGRFSPRVVKFTAQLLYNMWQHQDLREVCRKAGWKESHFITRTMVARNAASTPTSVNSTLHRPISTQGATKYEDRTLPRRGPDPNASVGDGVPRSRSEELPLNDVREDMEPPPPPHRPPVGGVLIFPPVPPLAEQSYAHLPRENLQQVELPVQGDQQGDSWV